jgi:hypothetical protein
VDKSCLGYETHPEAQGYKPGAILRLPGVGTARIGDTLARDGAGKITLIPKAG